MQDKWKVGCERRKGEIKKRVKYWENIAYSIILQIGQDCKINRALTSFFPPFATKTKPLWKKRGWNKKEPKLWLDYKSKGYK